MAVARFSTPRDQWLDRFYFNVAVPLAENDRFLTLAATDGGNGIESDSIIFGDPRLELVSAPTAVSSISREARSSANSK